MLKVTDLSITAKDTQKALVNNVSFGLEQGEILAIIGESGSGKTLTSTSIMGLLDTSIFNISGSITYLEQNLLALKEKEMAKFRLKEIAMIYQEPMSSFTPFLSIGKQIHLALNHHKKCSKKESYELIVPFLLEVGLGNIEDIFLKYPHELSGGQLQRILIALSLTLSPKILIADEPTTALDVYAQQEIMELLKKISIDNNLSILFISHDLNLVEELADRIIIMKEGQIIEENDKKNIFKNPKEDYTKKLLSSRISCLIEEESIEKYE